MIRTRAAREADAQRIADIYIETWRTTYAGSVPDRVLVNMSNDRQAIYWTRAIKQGNEIVGVAEDDKAGLVAVGSAGANRTRGSQYAGEVYTLYVQPDFQNQGIGEHLLAHLFREIHDRGMNSAVIWVLAANPSRFFYENMGGKRIGEREEAMWGTTLREIAYGWLDLEAALKAGRPGVR
ncbi:MAG: acetyltransferase, family [Rhodospirillales bacterium]|jgi:GNAT superfamily N-acetyltransferase|nr:acetyltransferase, family [Rhodospirillales bacterium]